MKKVETAAERYRRIKAERAKNEELVDVSCPSGMVFKCRRPNIQQFVISGKLPMTLAAKLRDAATLGNQAEELDWDDQVRTVDFINHLVRYAAVSPKIVEFPRPGQDEIGYDEVEIDDYNTIAKWAMPGGGEAESLETFRSE